MSTDLALIGRMLAFARRQAMPIASGRHVVIQSDAVVLAPIFMAGEDTTIHAIAIGAVAGNPEMRVVPDPRNRDAQYELFRWLASRIEAHFSTCERSGRFPQLWVSSSSAAKLVDRLSDRLRFNKEDAAIARLGSLLAYCTERHPIAGQQALMTATGALRSHYATGQQEAEDEHLGALLTWIDPPPGNVLEAVERAECEPMGANTMPAFDDETLEPLVTAYNEARRSEASSSELAARGGAIESALLPIVVRIYRAIQRAIALLSDFPAGRPGRLAEIETAENDEFRSFMSSRAKGFRVPLRDSSKAAVFKLVAREHAVESHETATMYADRIALASAVLAGRVVTGQVVAVRAEKVPRKAIHHVTLRTPQQALRVRARDTLHWTQDARLELTVDRVRRDGDSTLVDMHVSAGMRAVGIPRDGDVLVLGPAGNDAGFLIRQRVQMAKRLASRPWTHEGTAPAPSPRAGKPSDPLIAVEVLR